MTIDSVSEPYAILSSGGETVAHVRSYDCAAGPLGPVVASLLGHAPR